MVEKSGSIDLMKGLPFVAAVGALVITLLLLLPLHFTLYSNGMVAAFIICVIYFRRWPARKEMGGVLGCVLLLVVIRSAVFGWSHILPFDLSEVALFLALASLFMLLLPLPWDSKAGQRTRMADLGLALGVPAFAMGIAIPLWLEAGISPHTLDYNLYAFDASLGFHPSFWMGRMLSSHTWLQAICSVAYYGLPLMVVILATGPAVRVMRPKLLKVLIVAGVIGGTLYMVVPAASPLFVLHSRFPFDPPPVEQFTRTALMDVPQSDFRNCMPSLHFGWTLLIFLNVRWSLWRRIGSGLLVILIAISTVGFGQHYLIDLIVAVPFILAVQEASERQWLPVAINGALTATWLLALRFAINAITGSVPLAWIMFTATLVISLGIHNFEFSHRGIAIRRPASEEGVVLQPQASAE
jgi:PAP2 superfamily